MKSTLKKLTEITADNCITIIMNTHRTNPDSSVDGIQLKNLVKEAEQRLISTIDSKDAGILSEKMRNLANEINHNYNLESLILFVNSDIAEYARFPMSVTDRVVIDTTFATRDLVRADNMEANYYVLVLDKDKARLMEASSDNFVQELTNPFPIKNEQFDTANWVDLGDTTRQKNLSAEYFNQVDKEVNKIRNNRPLPILISASEQNFAEYLRIADRKNTIIDMMFNKKADTDKAEAIVAEAWEVMKGYQIKKNDQRKQELQQAVGQNKFLSDPNEIWKAIHQGQIETLFLEVGLFQSATLNDQDLSFATDDQDKTDGIIFDDIYDEMIERNMKFGGDVVFLPKGELSEFDGFGAITRY